MRIRMNWDALGITATLACAIHCAILPLFLNSLPLFGLNILHNFYFEAGMIILAFAIGISSLWHGYKKHHHKILPLIILSGGFIFLVLKIFITEHERWLLLPAVILIVSAHLLNFRGCQVARHCHVEDCEH